MAHVTVETWPVQNLLGEAGHLKTHTVLKFEYKGRQAGERGRISPCFLRGGSMQAFNLNGSGPLTLWKAVSFTQSPSI